MLARLLDSFTDIRSSRVCTCGLWIIGEYSTGQSDIEAALKVGRRGVLSWYLTDQGAV